uniref:Protein C10 n=1 Tax=Salvator merianae TaxID=96440 RepID=A0A8D0C7T2_SALMN
VPISLSGDQAKVIVAEVIKAFSSLKNTHCMEEARYNACSDMDKMSQFLLPIATQIQQGTRNFLILSHGSA